MESPDHKNDSRLTLSQQKAVEARGNVLVMAGAGTGKTTTLIARCLDCLERDGAAVDEMLIVTFTEAAAAKLRKDLRAALENKLKENPGDLHYAGQLTRFDLMHIGTLHGFCFQLVREHFYELGLDPHLAILDEGEARQLVNETLDEQFTAYYAGEDEFSLAVQNLIQDHGGGDDGRIRKLVLQLHNYSQARPDAAGWLARQREKVSSAKPADWQRWLPKAIESWLYEWLPVLVSLGTPVSNPARSQNANDAPGRETGAPAANEKAAELAAILSRLGRAGGAPGWRETAAEVLGRIVSADGDDQWPARRKTALRTPLKDIFAEAEFLRSLAVVKDGIDPLVED
jgi:ATP-dependent exoDNAse (exonuclease V) beta subunit